MNQRITRALLIEDEEDAREILGFYLGTVFDEVDEASDGQEGFDKFHTGYKENRYYDVIVTDIQMPHKDGLTMLEEIAAIKEDQKFIVVSAYKDEEYLFRSINLNVISYFVKPLVVENIMQILKKVKKSILESPTSNTTPIDTKPIRLNSIYTYDKSKKLLYDGKDIVNLSKKESLLVDVMVSKKGEINTNESLKIAVWDDINRSDATLRTVIKRVKDKISKSDFIVSKKGLGYMIE